MRRRSAIWQQALATVLAAAMPAAARAAADCYLKLSGVPGESTAAGHRHWIEAGGCAFAAAPGASGGEVTLRKSVDRASPLLTRAAASGKRFAVAELTVRKAGQEEVTYVLRDVVVAALAGEAGSAPPTETLTLRFARRTQGDQPDSDLPPPIFQSAPPMPMQRPMH